MLIRYYRAGVFAITIFYSMRFSPAKVMGTSLGFLNFVLLKMYYAFDTARDS